VKLVWHGREIVNKVEDTLVNRMQVLGVLMVRDIQRMLRVPGPTKTQPQYPASAAGEPPHTRSRRLLRSITSELDRQPVPILRVGTNVKYAKWLELGTGPYTIHAKSGKMLRWKGDDGEWHFAREVHHPGIAPRPFLRPALMRARRDIQRLLRRGAR